MRFIISAIILLLALLGIIICNACAQKTSAPNAKVDGKWIVELNSNDIGSVSTILMFKTADNGTFKAWTRKGADRSILGFWKSTLARIFTKEFKNGSLIRITDGTITSNEDKLVLTGDFRSAMGNYSFNGEITNNQLYADLKDRRQNKTGTLTGSRNENIDFPLEDYPAIVSEALDTTKDRIFNREVLKSKEWKNFERTVSKKSAKFQDDIELVFAFYYFASKLPFSHFALTNIAADPNQTFDNTEKQFLFLEEKDKNTALLTIKSFSGTAAEVDSIFSVIIENNYKNLIVDLRNNTGGTIEAGMTFTRKVVNTTLTGGFFLTQNWFKENDFIPDSNQLEALPLFSDANYDLIVQGIHREKGLILKVEPSDINFKGDLFIITNRRTASTCEPIVHALKTKSRATIVGQRTAGAMLNSEKFELKSGFSLIVPTADYYTIDGFRLDQNGVNPNNELKDEDPIVYVMKHLIE